MVKRMAATDVVTKISTANPRRKGSRGCKLWDMYETGDSVGAIESRWDGYRATLPTDEAKKASAVRRHLEWDQQHGDIRVGPAETAPVEAQPGNGGDDGSAALLSASPKGMSIPEAKIAMAAYHKVPESWVEVAIRG